MNHLFFNKIDSEIKAYLLGFYVGDGSISIRKDRKEYSIKFSQKRSENYIINLIVNTIGNKKIYTSKQKVGKIKGKEFISQEQEIVTYYSRQMVIDLISLGYGLKKTYRELHLPKLENNKMILHFIRGYFDADGTCGAYLSKRSDRKIGTRVKPTFHITSKTKTLLLEIQEFLLKEYAIKIPIYFKDYWVLKSGSKKEIEKLYEVLYDNSNFFIPYKEEKFKKVKLTSSEFRELKSSRPCNA